MKRVLLLVTLLCGAPSVALASGDAIAGDATAGKALTATCAACHGQDGNSSVGAFPKLAGQNQRYLVKQLQDIKSGLRPVPQMAGQTDDMSAEDMANIAAFYESQTTTVGQAKADLVELGESIYRAGIADKGVPACGACHSPTGQGNGPAGFPALGGQHAEYLAAQLKAFRTGADQPEKGRVNDGESRMMRTSAALLSDLEIDAVSSYISGLHP
jgi:cytochrome c553